MDLKYLYLFVPNILWPYMLMAQDVHFYVADQLKRASDLVEVNIDSAFMILTELDRNPTLDELERASVFKTWAEAWYYVGNLDSTQTYYTKAFDLYDTNREDSLAFEMLFEIGIANRRSGRYHEATKQYHIAMEYARNKQRSILEADAINAIGVIHYYQGNMVSALENYLQAMRAYERLDIPSKLAKSYNNLGIIYKVNNNYQKAIEYYRKSINIRKQNGHYHTLEPPYYNINNLYHFLNQPELALKASKEAYSLALAHAIVPWQRSCHRMLAEDYLILDDLDSMDIHIQHYRRLATDAYWQAFANQLKGKYWVAKAKYESGVELLLKALATFEQESDFVRQEKTHLYLSEAYQSSQQYALAAVHAKKALTLASEEENNPVIRMALELLYKTYEASGDMANAYKYLMLYRQKQDSTFNETKAAIIGGMEAEQRLIVKEQENLLLQNEAKLNAEIIKQQDSVVLFSIVAAGLLACIGFLVYKGQSNKRKIAEMALQVSEGKADRIAGELEYKNKEIVNFALQITEKNEFIEMVNHQINKLKTTSKEGSGEIQKLAMLVRDHLSISRQREEFNAHVENVYDAFFKRLDDRYPGLSQAEKKLAALLRLNLSSKEIASVVNISPKSVDMNRYRLRKKMGLENEVSLTEALQAI
ncbi:MAG: tetratricopeptide repeat protein [Cytophagales bacterium]|nr:tetratricopeptide repeat protein [Cytophagales bacterium]